VGLYFFEATLFDAVPVLQGRLLRALQESYPDARGDVGAILEFGSWIAAIAMGIRSSPTT